jgi:anti-sigma regulatory factor (Ser/Thr protein kinase)
MRWTFPAEKSAPARARRAAEGFAAGEGAEPDTVSAIQLCVSEAVSNAVVHAYRGSADPGTVQVEARRPNGYLCVHVRDQGCGLAPRMDSPGLGLGLPLITQSAAAVEVRRPAGGGTEVVMRFDLAA